MHDRARRPTPRELKLAANKHVRDVIAPGLCVLFCGINPSLYTAAVGFHFARPGNRFWPVLHAAGFTPRLCGAEEQEALLELGLGITNVVSRATAKAAELAPDEVVAGGRRLRRKVLRYRPKVLAVLGIGAYRRAFARPQAGIGLQPDAVGETAVWVLPNPSGLNAHYQHDELVRIFGALHDWARHSSGGTNHA